MKVSFLFSFVFLFSVNINAQKFFSPTYATASKKQHVGFMKKHKVEIEKRAALWKVPAIVVQVIASVQSGGGTQPGFNYGAVLPIPQITKYDKFSNVANNGLVVCEKKSRGLEAIALALNAIKSETGLKGKLDLLHFVFGKGGDLTFMSTEAEKAYKAYTGRGIILTHNGVPPISLTDNTNKNNSSSDKKEVPGIVNNRTIETVKNSTKPNKKSDEKEVPSVVNNRTKETVKDSTKNIAVIETYENTGVTYIKEKEDTTAATNVPVITSVQAKSEKADSIAMARQIEMMDESTRREYELRQAGKLEAERIDAEMEKAKEFVMKQRQAAKERQEKKAKQKAKKDSGNNEP